MHPLSNDSIAKHWFASGRMLCFHVFQATANFEYLNLAETHHNMYSDCQLNPKKYLGGVYYQLIILSLLSSHVTIKLVYYHVFCY